MLEPSLELSERFYSIQGESTRAGLPCLFIRVTGCNLRCSYCDSSYTWNEPGQRTLISNIIDWVEDYPGVMVEVTGGEPLLQHEVYSLIEALLDKGRTVLVETNGSISIEQVPDTATIILDIKCPDSGMTETMNWDNVRLLKDRARKGSQDEVKFVLSSEKDFHWAKDIVDKFSLNSILSVLFSPNEETFRADELAKLLLHHQLNVRLQIQLHRTLWPNLERGV